MSHQHEGFVRKARVTLGPIYCSNMKEADCSTRFHSLASGGVVLQAGPVAIGGTWTGWATFTGQGGEELGYQCPGNPAGAVSNRAVPAKLTLSGPESHRGRWGLANGGVLTRMRTWLPPRWLTVATSPGLQAVDRDSDFAEAEPSVHQNQVNQTKRVLNRRGPGAASWQP